LDGDIKLVTTYDISPSSFPNTRLELLSNTYQMYRFDKLEVTYSTLLPTAINGLFMAYIDTDPSDDSITKASNSTDLLRIAKSHQGSKQGKIMDNWKVYMPQRKDDQFFFIGNDGGDQRLGKMGKLYIYQIGIATKFDGTPLKSELVAGALNINWTCTFMNPQLQSLTRIYDGITEKDVNRFVSGIDWYRTISKTTPAANVLPGTRFRHETYILGPELFMSKGDYVLVQTPLSRKIANTIKSLNIYALPYQADKPYSDTLHDLWVKGKVTLNSFVSFADKAFNLLNGGIAIAGKIYDVIQFISPVFLASQALGVQVEGDIFVSDGSVDSGKQTLPIGQTVVHNDGINPVKVEVMIEFVDAAHAADPTVDVNTTTLFTAFKLKLPPSDGSDAIVKPKLPNIDYV
jgi:hypothetical protein